jgi:hypothetical protein
MADAFTAADACKDAGLLILPVRRDEGAHRLADDFARSISEKALGALIPAGDYAFEVRGQNGVVRGLNDGATSANFTAAAPVFSKGLPCPFGEGIGKAALASLVQRGTPLYKTEIPTFFAEPSPPPSVFAGKA